MECPECGASVSILLASGVCSSKCRHRRYMRSYYHSHPEYRRDVIARAAAANGARLEYKSEWRRGKLKDPDYRAASRKLNREWRIRNLYGDILTPEEMQQFSTNPYKTARALGYRSGLEVKVARELEALGVKFEYETVTIKYTKPEKQHRYTPDLLLPNGILVELKGRYTTQDRTKTRLVLDQHPGLDIRLVFSNSRALIGKKSSTSYGLWAERMGIPYADKSIPLAWINEKPCPKRLAALKALTD